MSLTLLITIIPFYIIANNHSLTRASLSFTPLRRLMTICFFEQLFICFSTISF